jgi:hypothetical protein
MRSKVRFGQYRLSGARGDKCHAAITNRKTRAYKLEMDAEPAMFQTRL